MTPYRSPLVTYNTKYNCILYDSSKFHAYQNVLGISYFVDNAISALSQYHIRNLTMMSHDYNSKI